MANKTFTVLVTVDEKCFDEELTPDLLGGYVCDSFAPAVQRISVQPGCWLFSTEEANAHRALCDEPALPLHPNRPML